MNRRGDSVGDPNDCCSMKACPTCKADYSGSETFCPLDGSRLSSLSQMSTDAPAPGDPLVGLTLGDRYRIIGKIGEGGMGIVYEALHVVIEKRVALKVLRDDFSNRPEVVARFRQEAKSASRIGHEHIVDISDFGETPTGQSYFVMEFLEGEDLAGLLSREKTLDSRRAVSLLLQCCRALGAAHAKGIVHRDMKPENVFLVSRGDQDDFVKIVDFGIAKMSDEDGTGDGRKLTKTGMIFGTPEYMSPEQAAGKELDHRVDVYACAVILFEMLCGRVPFVGDTFMGILTQHMFNVPPSLVELNADVDCPAELEDVIQRGLSKDPDERFESMEDMAQAISMAMDLTGSFHMGDSTVIGYGEPVKALKRGPRLMEAETVDSGEFPTRDSAGGKGKRTVWMGALAVLLLGAGIVGWQLMAGGTRVASVEGDGSSRESRSESGPAGVGAQSPDEETEESGEATASKGAVAEESDEGPTDDGSELTPKVSLQVDTQPRGASVSVEGRGVVCEPTPCAFDSELGKLIRVSAKRGRAHAMRELIPNQAMAIEMNLSRPSRSAGTPSASASGRSRDTGSDGRAPAPSRERLPGSGDLKIPDIFRR